MKDFAPSPSLDLVTPWRTLPPYGGPCPISQPGLCHPMGDCAPSPSLHLVTLWRTLSPRGGPCHPVEDLVTLWRTMPHLPAWTLSPHGGLCHPVEDLVTLWRTLSPHGGPCHIVEDRAPSPSLDFVTPWGTVPHLPACTLSPHGGPCHPLEDFATPWLSPFPFWGPHPHPLVRIPSPFLSPFPPPHSMTLQHFGGPKRSTFWAPCCPSR